MSNLRGGRDLGNDQGRLPTPNFTLRHAERHEVHAALQLILGANGRPAAEEHVVDFLRFTIYRGINLNGMWVIEHHSQPQRQVIWAILPVVSPGRTMLLFTPTYVPSVLQDDSSVAPLLNHILEQHRDQAVDLAQVLLDPNDVSAVRLFQQCAFQRLAELIYLDRSIHQVPEVAAGGGFTWDTYTPARHEDFARAIAGTYQNSLDCPRLNGRRNVQDVIAGHKSTGEFDPGLWFLLRAHGASVGVLLLNRSTRTDSLELVYLGLLPSARGRGLGDLLIRQSLAAAASAGSRRLSLAVDAQNTPALKLYKRHGFSRVCTRIALMRDLRENRATMPAAS